MRVVAQGLGALCSDPSESNPRPIRGALHCTSRGSVQRLALIRIACGTECFLLFEHAFSGSLSAERVRLEDKRFTPGSILESIVASKRSPAVVMTLAFMPLAAVALDASAVRQVWETHPLV